MVLADRIRLANTRQLLRAFGGLNETYGCSEAEYSAGVNFSTRDFPALSTRTPRRKLRALTGLNGMYHLNGLLTVCGRDVVYTPDDAAAPAVTKLDAVTDGRKALVGIGTKILIFPDKLAFDTADGSVAALGALWTAAGKSVTFAPCDAAGKTYQVEAFGREEPAEPADGQLFLKVEDAGHPWRYDSTLEMYSKNSGSWAAVPLEYCRITAAGLGKLFRQWDTVTVQGAAAEAAGQSPELNGDQIVYDVGEDWLRVRCTPQGEYFYGTLVQNAAAAQWQSMDGKQHRSVEAAQTVSMERRVPELDFVTECDNRVWGCNSRENVIYGCKLGDPTNWFSYRGIAADSYAVTVGSDGAFTGAASCMGYALFFKENTLHKLYGSKPSDFQLSSRPQPVRAERDVVLSLAGRRYGVGRQSAHQGVRCAGRCKAFQRAKCCGWCAGWPVLPAHLPGEYTSAGLRYREGVVERGGRLLLRYDQHRRAALSVGRTGAVGSRPHPRAGLAEHRRRGNGHPL